MDSRHPTKRIFGPQRRPMDFYATTALITIDMQYLDAHPGSGILAQAQELGVLDHYQYYIGRLTSKVIPNIQRMQEVFRRLRWELIHVHIESLSKDGRDRSPLHRLLQIEAPSGSKEAEFIPELVPQLDEIIISKTTSSPFNSSNIDFVLRNLGVTKLVVAGVMTSGCVESTVRDAADLGYEVILVSDACAARTEELESKTHEALDGTFAHIMTTDSVLSALLATSSL